MMPIKNIPARIEKKLFTVRRKAILPGINTRLLTVTVYIWLIVVLSSIVSSTSIQIFRLNGIPARLTALTETENSYSPAGLFYLSSQGSPILVRYAGFASMFSKIGIDNLTLYASTEFHTHESGTVKRSPTRKHIAAGLIATGLWFSFAFLMLMLRKKRINDSEKTDPDISINTLMALHDPTLIWKRVDNRYVLEYCNQAALDLTHETYDEIIGTYARDFFRMCPAAKESIENAYFSGKTIHRDLKIRFNTISDVKNISCDLVKIDDYHVLNILHVSTSQCMSSSTYKTSSCKFIHYAENLPIVVYQVEFFPKPHFSYINDYISQLTGYTPDEYYQNPALGFKVVHPDDRQRLQRMLLQNYDFNRSEEIRWIGKDGAVVWSEHYSIPLYDDIGNLIGIEGIAYDITERKEYEQQLSYYQNAIDGVSDMITIIDCSYRHVFANETYMLYHSKKREEIIGSKLDEIFSGPEKWYIIDKITRSLNGEQITYETTVDYPIIGERNLEIINTPLHEGNEITGVIAVIRDITDRKSAEMALRESETRYRALFEASLDAICMTDPNGILTDANPAMTELVGYELDELTGSKVSNLFHSQDDYSRFMVHVRKRKFIRNRDVLIIHKNGTTVECLITATARYGINGEVIGYQAIIHDITELKKVQNALVDSEMKFRAIADYAHNLEIWFGTDGKILWVNNVAEKMTGYTQEEALSSDDVLQRVVHIDHFNYINHIFHDALSNQTTGNDVPFLFVRKDGSTAWFATSWRPIYDHKGVYIGIRVSLRDITDSKKTEDDLADSEKRFRHVVEAVPFPVMIFDKRGNTSYINPVFSQTLGFTDADIVSHARWLTLAFPSDEEINNGRSRWKEAVNGIRGKPIEYANIRIRRSDGELRTLYSTYIPIDEENIMFVAEDITRRVIAEEEVRESLREKDVLLREIHHRVKNNMQVISSLLMLQGERIRDTEYYSVFQESINRIHSMAIIHEMLYQTKNFSRIDAHDYFLNISSNIRSMYLQVAPSVEINVDVENITLEIDFAIPCGLIVNELISNALKYAFGETGKGTITVSMKETAIESFILTVTDDGAGIPEDFKWRETSSLGLRIVRLLAERQLHGSIEKLDIDGTGFVISFEKFETHGNNDVSAYEKK